MTDYEEEVSVSPWVKTGVYVGVFMVRLLDCIPWVWGNLAVYVNSYYYVVKKDTTSAHVFNWLTMLNSVGFSVGVLLGGLLMKRIGLRLLLFISITTINVSLLLSYLTVQHSVIALCFTFGALTGLSAGITQICQICLLLNWTTRYQGLATTSIPSSSVMSSIFFNLFFTMYINPDNETADGRLENTAIFTQKDLANRVPSSFLIYAFISIVLTSAGFLLIRERPGSKSMFREVLESSRCRRSVEDEMPLTCTPSTSRSNVTLEKSNNRLQHCATTSSQLAMDNGNVTNEGQALQKQNRDVTNESQALQKQNRDVTNENQALQNRDVTPREAMKKREFYALFLMGAIKSYGFFVINTYYKTFGLLFIPDDHFLTSVAMVKCFFTPVCSWVAGFSVDWFGIKPTIVVVSTLFCIISSLFYLTVANQWLYFFSCVAYGSAVFTMYCLLPTCCLKYFGSSHFPTINGMVLISTYALTFTVPPLSEWIIVSAGGWFALFITAGVLAFLNVIILIGGLTEK